MRPIVMAIAGLFMACALGGCSEEPQRLGSAEKPGFVTDAWHDQLRERTLRQGESRRIYH